MIAAFSERRRRLAIVRAVLCHQSLDCADAGDVIRIASAILYWVNTGDEPSGAALSQFPQRHAPPSEVDAA